MQTNTTSPRRRARAALVACAIAALTALSAQPAAAASSKGCVGGGFSLVGQGRTVSGPTDAAIPAADLGSTFLVKGHYVEFTVVADSFAVTNWTLTGAPNELDITGGRRTVVFAERRRTTAGSRSRARSRWRSTRRTWSSPAPVPASR